MAKLLLCVCKFMSETWSQCLLQKFIFFFSDNWVPLLIYKVCAICLGRALAAVRRDWVHMGKPELQQG